MVPESEASHTPYSWWEPAFGHDIYDTMHLNLHGHHCIPTIHAHAEHSGTNIYLN